MVKNVVKDLFRRISIVGMAALMASSSMTTLAWADEVVYVEDGAGSTPEALPLPKLTGKMSQDILAVAQSQLGYTTTENSIYWEWAGSHGSPKSWCSEFATWCASHAGIPEDIIPVATSSAALREFFYNKSSYFTLEGGCEGNDNCNCKYYSNGSIGVDDIKPGDIVLLGTNSDKKDDPDHTAIVLSVDKNDVYTIDGNVKSVYTYDGMVEIPSTVLIRQRHREKASDIHGICRPDYNDWSGETFAKKNNPMTIKNKELKMEYSSLKKKTLKFRIDKAVTISKAKGKVTYELVPASQPKYNKYFSIDKKTGQISVKKKLKRGIYFVLVKVKAAGNSSYDPVCKTAYIKVKVK